VEPSEQSDIRKQRLARRRRRVQSEQQLSIGITVGGAVLVVSILVIVLLSSRGPRQTPEERAAAERAASAQVRKLVPPPVPTQLRKPRTKEQEEEEERRRRQVKHLSGKALREQINKEYDAAKRRAGLYVKKGWWGKAIQQYDRLTGRYDDEELRLRCQPEIDELMDLASEAFKDTKRAADQRAAAHEFDGGRKLLLDFAASCGIDDYAQQARELADKMTERKDTFLAAHYRQSMAPIEAMLPDWRLEEAVAAAAALRFDTPKYQGLHRARLAELKALAALKKQMIRKVNFAVPRVKKRAVRARGLPGDLMGADAKGLEASTAHGDERFTWVEIGPDAGMHLALLAGDPSDSGHRLAVARLMIEVGYLKQARQQLDAARRLGADTAADEERLARREPKGE